MTVPDLFDEATVRELAEACATLLTAAVGRSKRPVSRLRPLSTHGVDAHGPVCRRHWRRCADLRTHRAGRRQHHQPSSLHAIGLSVRRGALAQGGDRVAVAWLTDLMRGAGGRTIPIHIHDVLCARGGGRHEGATWIALRRRSGQDALLAAVMTGDHAHRR